MLSRYLSLATLAVFLLVLSLTVYVRTTPPAWFLEQLLKRGDGIAAEQVLHNVDGSLSMACHREKTMFWKPHDRRADIPECEMVLEERKQTCAKRLASHGVYLHSMQELATLMNHYYACLLEKPPETPSPETYTFRNIRVQPGRQAFAKEYQSGETYKAFAKAEDGAWGWCSGYDNELEALIAARQKCDSNRTDMERHCILINLNGQWLPRPASLGEVMMMHHGFTLLPIALAQRLQSQEQTTNLEELPNCPDSVSSVLPPPSA